MRFLVPQQLRPVNTREAKRIVSARIELVLTCYGVNEQEFVNEKELAVVRTENWLLFGGGLMAMAIGCLQFFLTQAYDLGWGITTFGLGIIALGRQQYDQFIAVLSRAGDDTSRNGDSSSSSPSPG